MKKRVIVNLSVLITLAVFLLTGCDPSKKWRAEEERNILDYITSSTDTIYELKPSGLYYHSVVDGTGLMPDDNDTVAIRYKGMFLNYNVFDSNAGATEPLKFIVGSGWIIKGLDEGVRYMKSGGRAKLVTPSSLAYGSYGSWPIPGYTALLWEIELVDVRPAP